MAEIGFFTRIILRIIQGILYVCLVFTPKFWKDLFSGDRNKNQNSREKYEGPLFQEIKSAFTPKKVAKIRSFFKGYGKNEILAVYSGSHGVGTIQRINEFINSKRITDRIRLIIIQRENVPVLIYIRGTFTEEESHFCLTELRNSCREGDKVLVSFPKDKLSETRE